MSSSEHNRKPTGMKRPILSFSSLIENSTDIITVIDVDTIIRFESPSVERILGYRPEELVGKSISEYVHPEDLPGVSQILESSAENMGVPACAQFRFRHKDGSWRFIEAVGQALKSGRRIYAVINSRDTTDNKQAEEQIRRRADEFAALYETARDLATVQELPPLLQTIVERAASLLGAASGHIFLHDAARHDLEIVAARGTELTVGTRFQLGEGMAGRVAQTYEPIIVNDYRTWEHRPPQMGDIPLAPSIAVPMLYRGELIGVLAVNEVGDTLRRFTEADARLLSLFASQAASAVHTARLLEEAQRRAQQLGLLYDSGLTLNRVLDPKAQLEFLFGVAMKALHADRVEFSSYDEARHELVLQGGSGYTPEALEAVRGHRFHLDDDRVITWVARNRVPLNIPDALGDSRWIVFDPQIRSGLWVPVEHENRLLGVVGILGTRANAFTPQDERLLILFANQVAVAMENARLFEETSRRLRQIRALHAIDLAIAGSLDLRFTLNVFLEQATNQLEVHAADILVLNSDTQSLEFSTGRGFRTKALSQTRLRLGEGYAGRAALERRTVGIPNLPEAEYEFRRSPLFAQEQFISYYAVPLIAKGEVKGVLEIFHRAALQPDEEWLDFLETLGGQAAIAIDNARLFDDLQRSNVELALAYDTTIEGWSRALDLRDQETEGHTQRVAEFTLRLGRAMGMSETELVHVRRGALLHDIGMVGISDGILLKPGPLTKEEWKIIRTHPEYAYQLLLPISYLRPALDIPYCHHERWNGTGYPRGLKGGEIPLAARVFAVADVWDALLSNRPYRAAWESARVREHIRSGSGADFDPKVVEAFLDLIDSSDPQPARSTLK